MQVCFTSKNEGVVVVRDPSNGRSLFHHSTHWVIDMFVDINPELDALNDRKAMLEDALSNNEHEVEELEIAGEDIGNDLDTIDEAIKLLKG
jgi:hypothetical protein